MVSRTDQSKLAAELVELVRPTMPGLTVEVDFSDRWNRGSVTFVWDGFAGLLPEERFHRLAQTIPEDFRATRMKGMVWLELVTGETVDTFLSHPRSEDSADQERSVYSQLLAVVFFDALEGDLGPAPDKACAKDFSKTVALLESRGFSVEKIRQAKLVFIRHGVYCDCQILFTARPALAETCTEQA